MNKKEKTFEEILADLEQIISELESGSIDLDRTIDKYSEAMKLAKTCNDKLKNATTKVNKILAENDMLEDFKIDE
ncbi:MAG TPA: exodeoxyribonuclease VII small subunit [Bacilli bacterium]|nr:exodeoxyribonuclease VII small subunit [Bacilli bacterium]